jgi:hypothetical protein
MQYRWQIEIQPVNEEEQEKIMERIPYDIDGHLTMGEKCDLLSCWGEQAMSGSRSTETRHQELRELFPGRKVVSFWRCTEFDGWDATYGI